MKYIRRNSRVNAIQWTGTNLKAVLEFMGQEIDLTNTITAQKWEEYKDIVEMDGLKISINEIPVPLGDYIFEYGVCNFCPCPADEFEASHYKRI